MNPVKFLTSILVMLFITGCATTSGPPIIGMKYLDSYPFGGVHAGLDLDVPYGSPVRAILDGETGMISKDKNEIYITISHGNGYSAMYYHLEKVVVQEREKIKRGQIIAYTGRTGYSSPARTQMITYPHLHLEVYKDGNRINPENLKMTCPTGNGDWWWPVGCADSFGK